MQVFAGHTGAVQCGEFTPDGWLCPLQIFGQSLTCSIICIGKRIITACSDGILIFWDPRSPTPLFKLSPADARFDLEGITSIAVNAASTIAVAGGSSGGIRAINLSKGEIVGAFEGHKEGESVEAVQFIDLAGAGAGAGVVITGGTDGKACIWDLSTSRLRASLEHEVRMCRLRLVIIFDVEFRMPLPPS